nr:hypothetical protein [Roseovarius sp.]
AELGGLYLTGSRAEQGVNLHRLTTKSNVQLRGGFHATGLVDLGGARIGGQLDCDGGRFDEAGEIAINCNAVRIKADALLRNAFHASRKVDFARARIEGDLQIIKARLDLGITLDGARVGGGLFWQDMQDAVHDVDLTEAQVRVLADDMASWEQVKVLHLSGFTYERIQSDMGIVERLRWLADKRERKISPAFGEESEFMGQKFKRSPPWIKGTDTPDFDPQPYTQLAKVLDTQGNRGEASRVRYEREKRMRPAALRRSQAQLDGSGTAALLNLFMTVRPIWDVPYRWVFGYSHLPALALIWIGLIWLLAFLLYGSVYAAGQMAPNSDVILTSADWLAQVTAYEPGGEMPMHAWLSTPAAKDYETFSAGLYALDLFLPLDALGQEAAWAPSKERGALGALGYWMRMPIQLAGWVITAVGAAVLTGLVGRKE